jgi:hypothetical protein
MLLLNSTVVPEGTYFYVIFGAVLYLVYSARSWYQLRHFDGPWLAKHSYLWLLGAVSSNKLHVIFPELHKKYGRCQLYTYTPNMSCDCSNFALGTTIRIGPNDLVTNDIKLLQRMSAARSAYSRSNWYKTQEVDSRGSHCHHLQELQTTYSLLSTANSLFTDTNSKSHDLFKSYMALAVGFTAWELRGLANSSRLSTPERMFLLWRATSTKS